jgi:hypothetical protein
MNRSAHATHDKAAQGHQDHAPMPTRGRALNAVSLSATLHCLTGCAIGEVLGMIIGTALGFSDLGTIALAVALAFFFGYTLTSVPLLRAGLAFSAVVPIALAADTFSITVMEIVDNAIMVIVPGAMESGVGDILFWGALSFALVVAGLVAFPVNRWLITRGKGHTAVHNTGIHGGPNVKAVGVVVAVMAVFGTAVLTVEAFDSEGEGHGAGHGAADEERMGAHEETVEQDAVRGLAASSSGMTLQLERHRLPRARRTELAFTVEDAEGAVTDFEVEHERRLHLIVVRRDMQGFQHLHPRMSADGRWSTPVTIDEAGKYRVFADFKHDGRNQTLARDVTVPGRVEAAPFPAVQSRTTTSSGYEVELDPPDAHGGEETELGFTVTRDGEHVEVERYLGADGHLVALREGDLAYLHVHPTAAGGDAIQFETQFPTAARYALFLQFKHDGEVHTASFAREVDP